MPPTFPSVTAADPGEYVGIPRLVGLMLGLATAVLFSLLRVGYATDFVAAPSYTFWSGFLMVASIAVGILAAGMLGSIGVDVVAGVLVGIAPIAGLSLGSLLTAAVGLGRYDSSPLVLVAGLLLSAGVLGGGAWFVGRTIT